MNIDLRLLNLYKIFAQSLFSILVTRLLLNGNIPFEQSMRPLVIAGYAAFLEGGLSRSAVDISALEARSYFRQILGIICLVIVISMFAIILIFGWSLVSLFGCVMLSTSLINMLLYQNQEFLGQARIFQVFTSLGYTIAGLVLFFLWSYGVTNSLYIFTVICLLQISFLWRFMFVPTLSFKLFSKFKKVIIKNALWTILLASTLSIAREFAILERNLVSVEVGIKLGLLLSSLFVSITFHLYSKIALRELSDIAMLKTVGFKFLFYVIVLSLIAIFLREIVYIIFGIEVEYWTTLKYIFLFSFPTVFDAIMKWIQSKFRLAQTFNMIRFLCMILGIALFLKGYGAAQYIFWQFVAIPLLAFIYFLIGHDRSSI